MPAPPLGRATRRRRRVEGPSRAERPGAGAGRADAAGAAQVEAERSALLPLNAEAREVAAVLAKALADDRPLGRRLPLERCPGTPTGRQVDLPWLALELVTRVAIAVVGWNLGAAANQRQSNAERPEA